MAEGEFEFIVIVVTMVFIAIVAIMTLAGVKSIDNKNASSPIMKKHGTVADRESINGNSVLFAETSILFVFDDGSRVRLRIPGQSNLVVGDTGTVTWQGTAFQNFEHDPK